MPEDFVIAVNPDPDSTLPYLVRLPLPRPVVLKVRDTWPRTAKVYCHPAEAWPDQPDVVERVPVRSCVRRGAAVDLVLDRGRESRSQFVFARARGREMIFWQSARTAKQARPAVDLPTRRASELDALEILVDVHERYPYRFSHQQCSVRRHALASGDYAVECDGAVVAAVERKSLPDLVSSLTSGRLGYAMGELASLPHAAVVVEDRYSAVFRLEMVRPSVVAEGLADAAVRWPGVPIIFTETRPLAEEWVYRFLGAAVRQSMAGHAGERRLGDLTGAPDLPAAPATTAQVRAWAVAAGLPVSDRGRLRPDVWQAYLAAHP